MPKPTASSDEQKDLDEALLRELERFKADKLRQAGDAGVAVFGAVVGAAASGTAASLAGATAIPVLTAVGQAVGLSVATATPVGWVVACGLIGGAACYGVSRLIFRGARIEGTVLERKKQTRLRLKRLQAQARADSLDIGQLETLQSRANAAVAAGQLDAGVAQRLVDAVVSGRLGVQRALDALPFNGPTTGPL
jgi:hypothetical protein